MAARIALLLHMHQPDYRGPLPGDPHGVDPEAGVGEPRMPWVRLHACRGYLDVADAIERHGVEATVNIAPSLLEQLEWYASGGSDSWARLAATPAEELSPAQAAFVRARFVCGHPAMHAVSPRYRALAARAPELESPQELRDLQVWSNLAWMGAVGRRRPEVAELIDQDRDYSQAQLEGLLALQHGLCAEVLERWRRLPSLSCSPQTHPILPLLVNFSHARRALPHLPDEVDFRHPEDALRQLREGRRTVARVLGRAVDGLWPSEGSVSPEVLELVAEAGFSWLATDEGILRESERDGPPRLTGPWACGPGGALRAVFRERDLSDRIGFRYAGQLPRLAVADLLEGADAVVARQGGHTVPVILDGENPWESFPDAGEGFLDALFATGRVTGVEALAREPAVGRLRRIHTGSWINADLAIWAGDEEDRAAWRELARVRRAWAAAGEPEAAWPHLAAAEGSDWFWWLGPEFDTPVADLFAGLFADHLAAAEAVIARARGGEALAGGGEAADGVEPAGTPRVGGARSSVDPGAAGWVRVPTVSGGSQASASAVLRHGRLAAAPGGLRLELLLAADPELPADLRVELGDLGHAACSLPPRREGGAVRDPRTAGVVRELRGRWSEGVLCLELEVPLAGERPLSLALGLRPPGRAWRRLPAEGWHRLSLVPSTRT